MSAHHSQHRGQHRSRREGQENLEWEGVIGSLTSATIEMNFDSLKLRQLQSYSVQSVSSFQHHLHCIVGKTMDSLDLNMKC